MRDVWWGMLRLYDAESETFGPDGERGKQREREKDYRSEAACGVRIPLFKIMSAVPGNY